MGVHDMWTADAKDAELAKEGPDQSKGRGRRLDPGPPLGRDWEQVKESTQRLPSGGQ